MAIRKNKKQPINKRSRVKNSTITDLSDFDPETTIVFDGYADFAKYRKITDLGNLQIIKGGADFSDSQVQDLGNLQTIGGNALFSFSQVQDLGNLQTIGGSAFFGSSKVKRLGNLQTIGGRAYFGISTDLEAEWEQRQEGYDYADGGGVGENFKVGDKIKVLGDSYIILSFRVDKSQGYEEQRVIMKNNKGEISSYPLDMVIAYSKYAKGGGVGMPNAAWFVFQEKFPEAFEYYLKNNEYGVSKGDLMAMAYQSTRNVDSAIPMELWQQVDNTMFYVYDYQNSSFGELVDLREKIKTSEVPVALSFVIDMHGYYGDDLPNELKNADFATALMYVYANRDVIDEFYIRPKRNVNNYAEGGGVGDVYTLKDKDDTWYLTYIDSTHFFLSNTKEYKGSAYHIGQFRTRPFYNEVLSWLKSHKGQQSYAKGGGVDMYSKFDFNEKGNLSARINKKNYEIEYNDADGVYELFENGERVQSNKNVRTLTQFIQVSDFGNFREGQSVMIAEDNDNENYDDFRGKELVIYHKATNEKEHRGFDNSMEGQALYSFFLRETGEQVPFSCYDYELEQY